MSNPSPIPSGSIVSNVKFNDITSVHVNPTWCNGAYDNRIIVVSELDNIEVPVDGEYWEASGEYGKSVYTTSEGGLITSSVVYKGTQESSTVYNLKYKTKYFFYFFEYNIVNQLPEYNTLFTVANVVTGGSEYTNSVNVNVSDDLTSLDISDADITITNRNGNIISKGRPNGSGKYTSKQLPIGGIHIDITAPGYRPMSLKSVFIKNMKRSRYKSNYKKPSVMTYDIKLVKL